MCHLQIRDRLQLNLFYVLFFQSDLNLELLTSDNIFGHVGVISPTWLNIFVSRNNQDIQLDDRSQTAHPAASCGACSRRSLASQILTNSFACSLPSLRGFLASQHNCGLCPTSHHHLQFRCIPHHSKIHFPKAVS